MIFNRYCFSIVLIYHLLYSLAFEKIIEAVIIILQLHHHERVHHNVILVISIYFFA